MRCRRCKNDSLGSLCLKCEKEFRQALKEQVNIEYDFNIGDTLYTLKSINVDKKRRFIPVKVIFRGPNSWLIRRWIQEGDKHLKERFLYNKYTSVFECNEFNTKIILQRQISEFYLTEAECIYDNEKLLKESIYNSRKELIYNLIDSKLKDVLLDDINIDNLNNDDFLLPVLDEMKVRTDLYKQIRGEVKRDILANEKDAIRNEIINELYNEIKEKFSKAIDKFIRKDINSTLEKYSEELQQSISDFIKNIIDFK